MPQIHYQPDGRTIDIAAGQTILAASLDAGIPFAHSCGGNARCSTCRVLILDGVGNCSPRTPAEQALVAHLHFDPAMRLACQTRIHAPVTLRRLVLDSEDAALASSSAKLDMHPGEEKRLAILFADIVGFTPFSARLLPYDAIHSLNRYFHHIGPVIAAHGGVINNYMGDGFMALFGLDDPADATLRATRAGLAMLRTVEILKPYFTALFHRSFDIRIGLHYGCVVIGSVGFLENQTTTVIGDAVNFASRIEAANKQTGTRFLLSKAARTQLAGRIPTRPHGPLKIPGKKGRHLLHEVLAD